MKKTVEELRDNGYYVTDGREYILTEQPSYQSDPKPVINDWHYDNYYSARAICPNEKTDEYGYQKCYLVRWEILPTYDPETDGEDCACDWGEPKSVTEFGEYNLETVHYY